MKKIITIILAVFLINTIIKAQDTLYMYQNGVVINKQAVEVLDSITFYKVPDAPSTTVTDIDGNIYNYVTIGTQTWMSENLKVTKYNNGDLIGTTSSTSIPNDVSSKYQWAYKEIEDSVATYGRLYTWYAATDARGVCPTGWHLPSDAEWTTLTDYLGGESVAGGKLKKAGTTHWNSPNEGATNETGFTALPSGYRDYNGSFYDILFYGNWWSSTESGTSSAWYRDMGCSYSNVSRYLGSKKYGFSVRCLRD
jgi:uncharacterized protein (TIGR02145 family)